MNKNPKKKKKIYSVKWVSKIYLTLFILMWHSQKSVSINMNYNQYSYALSYAHKRNTINIK